MISLVATKCNTYSHSMASFITILCPTTFELTLHSHNAAFLRIYVSWRGGSPDEMCFNQCEMVCHEVGVVFHSEQWLVNMTDVKLFSLDQNLAVWHISCFYVSVLNLISRSSRMREKIFGFVSKCPATCESTLHLQNAAFLRIFASWPGGVP